MHGYLSDCGRGIDAYIFRLCLLGVVEGYGFIWRLVSWGAAREEAVAEGGLGDEWRVCGGVC